MEFMKETHFVGQYLNVVLLPTFIQAQFVGRYFLLVFLPAFIQAHFVEYCPIAIFRRLNIMRITLI